MTDRAAFIFDMDGVIVDSTSAHVEAWKLYLQSHGLSADGIESRMLGKHNDELVRDFFAGRELSEQDIFEHGARKEQIYRDMMAPVLPGNLVPGVTEFIQRHRDRSMGLATNAEPANVEFVLTTAGLRWYFGAIVNGQQVERPKPAPDIYLHVAGLLGVKAEDCVVFEDSPAGIQAARSAGMRVVGLTTTCPDLNGVDLAIPNFLEPELETWLRSSVPSA
jgi:beta-phosphoglucomutase